MINLVDKSWNDDVIKQNIEEQIFNLKAKEKMWIIVNEKNVLFCQPSCWSKTFNVNALNIRQWYSQRRRGMLWLEDRRSLDWVKNSVSLLSGLCVRVLNSGHLAIGRYLEHGSSHPSRTFTFVLFHYNYLLVVFFLINYLCNNENHVK